MIKTGNLSKIQAEMDQKCIQESFKYVTDTLHIVWNDYWEQFDGKKQWCENCGHRLEKGTIGSGTAPGFFCMAVETQQT
jgi:hypothetical protein